MNRNWLRPLSGAAALPGNQINNWLHLLFCLVERSPNGSISVGTHHQPELYPGLLAAQMSTDFAAERAGRRWAGVSRATMAARSNTAVLTIFLLIDSIVLFYLLRRRWRNRMTRGWF
jgi:hypothetical protein